MKWKIEEDPACAETEVIIRCRAVDETILKISTALHAIDKKITGVKDGKTFVLDPSQIYYFESVDKHTFLYTARDIYETQLRLYELEERLTHTDFFRASKSTIINLGKVKVLNPILGGKIETVLENNERLVVSRQYVPILKNRLE